MRSRGDPRTGEGLQQRGPPTVLILGGVAGVGKTTIGREVAATLGWSFLDADTLHTATAVAKMHRGEGLSEDDRRPWLTALRQEIDRHVAAGEGLVLAASALRAAHRRQLRGDRAEVSIVLLSTSRELLLTRLQARRDHFAGPELLASQLAAWEPPAPNDPSDETPIVTSAAEPAVVARQVLEVVGLSL